MEQRTSAVRFCSKLLQILNLLLVQTIKFLCIAQIPFRQPLCIRHFMAQVTAQCSVEFASINVICSFVANISTKFPIELQNNIIDFYRCLYLAFPITLAKFFNPLQVILIQYTNSLFHSFTICQR